MPKPQTAKPATPGSPNKLALAFARIFSTPEAQQALRYAMEEDPTLPPALEDEPEEEEEEEEEEAADDNEDAALNHEEAADEALEYSLDFDDSDLHDEDEEEDEEEPEQYAAGGMAMASGSNGCPPGAEHGQQHYSADRRSSKPAKKPAPAAAAAAARKPAARMAADSQRLRYARQQQQINALHEQLRKSKRVARYARAEQRITQLEAEGYVLDREEEVKELMRRKGSEWDAYEDKVRRCYQKAPISGMASGGLIPVKASETRMPTSEATHYRRQMQVLRYQMDHKVSPEQAEKDCPANYPLALEPKGF